MMQFRLQTLELACKRSIETIEFSDISYFFGSMGSGKSTIARLIDFAFGGEIVLTPALQLEFVDVTLSLTINGIPCVLTRAKDANQVRATWGAEGDQSQLTVPARNAGGVLLPGTEVEVLSDLLFHLSGVKPPRVRRSKLREDSETQRLSFRDLFWYCYCAQENIDSSFFHLDGEANPFKRLKSLDVLRFVLGINQERVAELEVEFQEIREQRLRAEQAHLILKDTLAESDLTTDQALAARVAKIVGEKNRVALALAATRESAEASRLHATDRLRQKARLLGGELEALEEATGQIAKTLADDRRHLNEIYALSTKVQRVTGARSILNGVNFERCPRCTQTLPEHAKTDCPVCGRAEPSPEEAINDITATRSDIDARIEELEEIIAKQRVQERNLARRARELSERKAEVDRQLNQAFRDYDPTMMGNIVALEREMAGLEQEAKYVKKLGVFLTRADSLGKEAERLLVEQQRVSKELREARQAAEKDPGNLKRLTKLFADCLVRAKLSGFTGTESVKMAPPGYLPEVIRPEVGDVAIISFKTLGSGGIKTLFKACFLLAIHRLAVELKANLPSLIIIDSPMKNTSERENREQFEGFHNLVYELAEGELADTQFIIIDKEHLAPRQEGYPRTFFARHMRTDDESVPPLIQYYREAAGNPGKTEETSVDQGAVAEDQTTKPNTDQAAADENQTAKLDPDRAAGTEADASGEPEAKDLPDGGS